MSGTSTKPYLLRAIYEWCTDNGYTPYLSVVVDGQARVPMQFVKNGEIVLNISFDATSGLKMDNDFIHFHARFGGVSREISVPVENVIAIYARETGQGMAFEVSKSSNNEQTADENIEGTVSTNISTPSSILTAVPTSHDKTDVSDINPEKTPDPPKKGSGKPILTRIK